MEIMRIGLDLTKSVFEVFGVDEQEQQVLCKTLKRNQVMEFFALLHPCIVGIENCGSTLQWARKPRSVGHGSNIFIPSHSRMVFSGCASNRKNCP
ncbi:hypothetical protein [Marinobacterium rhizophilum]|uniref:hypothetical protein n=1 Tax=Marinobacterium rhizophilum TaxID=420402 RepID=UPI0012EBF106|nr:hypothetical protein [Marinobacterium rhizophilum]